MVKMKIISSVVPKEELKLLRLFFKKKFPKDTFGFEVEIPVWNRRSIAPGDLRWTPFNTLTRVVGRDGAPRLVEIRFPPRTASWWLSDAPLIMLEKKVKMVAKFLSAKGMELVGKYNDGFFVNIVDPNFPIAAGIHFHIPFSVMKHLGLWTYDDADEYCSSEYYDYEDECEDCCDPSEEYEAHNSEVVEAVFGDAIRKSKELLGDRNLVSRYGSVDDFRGKAHGIEIRGFESTYHYPEWFAVTIFNAFESVRAGIEGEKPKLVDYPRRPLGLFLREMRNFRIITRNRVLSGSCDVEIVDGFEFTSEEIRRFKEKSGMPKDVAWVYRRDCRAVRMNGEIVMLFVSTEGGVYRVLWSVRDPRIVECALVEIMRYYERDYLALSVPRPLWRVFEKAGFVGDGSGTFLGWKRTFIVPS